MGKISAATIEQVNAQTDIVALVGEYTRLERKGSDWWGCCPFHNEKTASFHVVPDRKMYHCFGCGQGGGVINFYMEMEKTSFVDSVVALAKKSGIEVVYDGDSNFVPEQNNQKDEYISMYTRIAGTFRYLLTSTDMGKEPLSYLKSRGVSDEIAEKFQLGYAPKDRRWLKKFLLEKNYSEEFLANSGLFSKKYPDVAFFSDRLIFPICDRRGQVVAFGGRILHGEGPKYLNSGDLVQYKKGETLYAFNIAKQTIRMQRSVIFCEGYMDVIAYHQAGITNAVAPLGTALTLDQVKLISGFVDTVYLSFDSDKAGQAATMKAIILCRSVDLSVKVIRLTEGKDPAEILLNYGAETLTNNVSSAIIDADYLLFILAKVYPVDTPEGKTKIALGFFPYIDALKSDIQKESCFEQLSQYLGLSIEAVKADFSNREAAEKRSQARQSHLIENVPEVIKPNAELRAVLAVTANMTFFQLMRSSLTADDFEDLTARNLFIILEECFREGAITSDNILAKCENTSLNQLIASVVMSGEFNGNEEQVKLAIVDSIKTIRHNSLERKRQRLLNKIRQFTVTNSDEQLQLDNMLNEKMNIDFELRK